MGCVRASGRARAVRETFVPSTVPCRARAGRDGCGRWSEGRLKGEYEGCWLTIVGRGHIRTVHVRGATGADLQGAYRHATRAVERTRSSPG